MTDPTFDHLLERSFADAAAEAELARRFGGTFSVLVAGFSSMDERIAAHGVGYALALAAAAERAMAPALTGATEVRRGGHARVFVFDRPEIALLTTLDAQRALAAFNEGRTGHVGHDANAPIRGRFGLGHGGGLHVPGRDVYGTEARRAFRLAEEAARPGEVLATDAFFAAHGPLPGGVGAFRAPGDREQAAGFSFHVLADYR